MCASQFLAGADNHFGIIFDFSKSKQTSMKNLLFLTAFIFVLTSCNKDNNKPEEAQLHFKFVFDENQERLNNFGQPASIPEGHAAQTPTFREMAAHYIELTPTMFTQVGEGAVLYQSPDTKTGGDLAIEFDKLTKVGNNEIFFSVPISQVPAGDYEYLRVSLAYQNYDIKFRAMGMDITGTLASFVGYNNYIRDVKIKDQSLSVNGNRAQGFWAFETQFSLDYGQAPATTVPNPIAFTSPIPPGSCLVTGKFETPFSISGNEKEDITVVVSLSVNQSFEWEDLNDNGIWEPLDGEMVVDMGIRGLVPSVE